MQQHPLHSPVPFTPLLQRAGGVSSSALKDPRFCDSRFSAGSYAAARRAAGAVVHAVEQVLSAKSRHALCIVRPPGHHAGRKGLVPGSESCGFCLFNSAMVGAMHALYLAGIEAVDRKPEAGTKARAVPLARSDSETWGARSRAVTGVVPTTTAAAAAAAAAAATA